MGGYAYNGEDSWIVVKKTTDMVNPSPSKSWVLLDEREDSINDGWYAVDMDQAFNPGLVVDYPAAYHSGAGGLNFADGHSEIRRWVDPELQRGIKHNQLLTLGAANAPRDMRWLAERTTGRK
jgi:hypothetical protein